MLDVRKHLVSGPLCGVYNPSRCEELPDGRLAIDSLVFGAPRVIYRPHTGDIFSPHHDPVRIYLYDGREGDDSLPGVRP